MDTERRSALAFDGRLKLLETRKIVWRVLEWVQVYLPMEGTGEDQVIVCGKLAQARLEFTLVD